MPSRIDTESNKKQVVELRAIKSTDEQPHTANETSKMRKPPPPPKPKSVSVGVIQMKKVREKFEFLTLCELLVFALLFVNNLVQWMIHKNY